MKKVDLTGKIFNRLTVISEAKERLSNQVSWECSCVCGEKKIIRGGDLTSGKMKSCGCLRREVCSAKQRNDLSGKRFGRLIALKDVGKTPQGKRKWECICDCGQTTIAPSGGLSNGDYKSCGCLDRDALMKRNTTHGQSKTAQYKTHKTRKHELKKKRRTPKWSNIEKIRQIYSNCPKGFHVDHIVPLNGEIVSGLHVPENLQYLTRSENSKKLNKFEPQFIEKQ